MKQINTRGEIVYRCNVCYRKLRIPSNKEGLDVIHNCTITAGCKGEMKPVLNPADINNTPALTPEVAGLQDWFQRNLLYTHNQNIAAAEWLVQHKLGNFPNIQVYETTTSTTKLTPKSITNVDLNSSIIIFDIPTAGIAQCTTLTSKNTINPPTSSQEPSSNVLISNNVGQITLATLDNTPNITVEITFVNQGTPSVTIQYTNIDNIPAGTSPWVGVSNVFINGKIFSVRTLDVVLHPTALPIFTSGQIPPQGTSWYITSINGVQNTPNSCFVLLANSPYGSIDKVTNKYVDTALATATNNKLLYSFNQVFAVPEIVKPTYPPIIVV